jgi:phage shock protein A
MECAPSARIVQESRTAWFPVLGANNSEETRMGVFSRFADIVNSNINAILDKAEDPEKIVRLMIQEMEDTLVEVRSAAARAIADKKEAARALATVQDEAADWQGKARLALDKGREDLAKIALAERARLVRSARGLQGQHAMIEESLAKLGDDIARLEEKLADAKSRQKSIVARHRTVAQRLQVKAKIHDHRIDDALVRFEQFERRMDDLEGRVEAYELGASKGLEHEFSDFESAEAIERELAELKAGMAADASKGA